ncbi:MAG: hypothetical protein ACRD26_17250, partial [Vicinamibacterales bacterium]
LDPTRDNALDTGELNGALAALTGGRVTARRGAAYEVLLGRAGDPPLLHRAEARPFRQRLRLPEGTVEIRMDGWVTQETFRRGGFGHVLVNRRDVLPVERGVSLATLDPGEPFYAAGIYALQPRFRIPAEGLPELALLH